MEFCCGAFKANHEMSGSRGFGVFATEFDEGDFYFIIQHRAMEPGSDPPPFTATPLSLVSEMYILYCPWCGTNLKEFYRNASALKRPDLKLG